MSAYDLVQAIETNNNEEEVLRLIDEEDVNVNGRDWLGIKGLG